MGALRAVDLADDAKTLTNGLFKPASAAAVLTALHRLLLGVLLSVVLRDLVRPESHSHAGHHLGRPRPS